jgi:hypothetical protein
MCPLFWLALPDNGDSRFLLPAVTAATLLPAFAFGSGRVWNATLHTAYLIAAVWLIVGAQRQIPASLPWFMGDWLALDGVVAPDSLAIFAACAAMTAGVSWVAARLRVPSSWAVVAVCVGAVGLSVGWPFSKSADSLGLRSLSPTYVRAGMVAGWKWTTSHVVDSVVAYSGNNVPYPLFGEHLSNSARYINIDRHANWRFHDYARARGKGDVRGAHSLAQPSGQLMPLVRGSSEASRPRFERWEAIATPGSPICVPPECRICS